MRIYRKLTGASLLLLSALPAAAVPAYPGLISVRQSDGSTLTIRRAGDEYHNMAYSTDGYALLYNRATRNYEYARLDGSDIVTSGIVAADESMRDADARHFLSGIDREAIDRQFGKDWGVARAKASDRDSEGCRPGQDRVVRINYNVPTTGDRDVLVILVEFADKKFDECAGMGDPREYYDRFFHEEGFSDNGCHGSAYDYYYKGSLGKYRPDFHVLGPIQVSGGYADYAGDGGSAATYRMIQEVVPLADSMYDIDFRQFDTDGDGLIDNVYCLYAGYGQADSPVSDSIWPHSFKLSAIHAEFEVDGVTVDRYTVSQQVNGVSNLSVGIGTFVHEFGHVLGLADHYNNSSPMGNPPNNVGNWDVMSSGSYNNDQNCPAPFSAFERYSLGWCEPTHLDPGEARKISISPYMDSGECFRIDVRPDDREYFLIENRQQTDWDSYLPGHGILVWHIEEDQYKWDVNKPNYDQNHQCVDIVEAGKLLTSTGHDSDAFPGTRDVRNYSFLNWNNSKAFGFEWVEEQEDGHCWFLLSDTDYRLSTPEVSSKDIMGTSAVVAWKGDPIADSYEISLLKDGTEVYYTTAEESGEVRVDGLEPETEYEVTVSSRLNSLRSETAVASFVTLARQIEEYTPVAYPAREITGTEFLARWREIPVATGYEISLYGRTHDAEGELTHGFDDFTTTNPGLPEGWEITPKQGRMETEYGQASPSVRLRDEDARLLVAVPGEKIDSISFWFSTSKAGVDLVVEKAAGEEWSEVWRYVPDRKREMVETIDVCEADSVRLVVKREEGVTGGYICLDDIRLYYIHDQMSPVRYVSVGPEVADQFCGGEICSFLIGELDPAEKYAFAVRGLYAGRHSMWSEIMKVEEGMDDPTDVSVEEIAADVTRHKEESTIYSLQGIRIRTSPDRLPPGIYIINGKKIHLTK